MKVVTYPGLVRFSQAYLPGGVSDGDNLQLRLYKSNAEVPIDGSTTGLTECAFGGYAAIAFTFPDNTGPVNDDDEAVVSLNGEPFIWDCTSAPETIYGWYLYNVDSGDVLCGEKYETPHVLKVGSRHTLSVDIVIGNAA